MLSTVKNRGEESRPDQTKIKTVRAAFADAVFVVAGTIFNGLTADTECTLEIQSWSRFAFSPVLRSRVSQVMHMHTWVHPCSCLHFRHPPVFQHRFACQENCLRYCNFPFWLLHFNNWMGQWLWSFVWHVRHKVSVWAIAYHLPATPPCPTPSKGACAPFLLRQCLHIFV